MNVQKKEDWILDPHAQHIWGGHEGLGSEGSLTGAVGFRGP